MFGWTVEQQTRTSQGYLLGWMMAKSCCWLGIVVVLDLEWQIEAPEPVVPGWLEHCNDQRLEGSDHGSLLRIESQILEFLDEECRSHQQSHPGKRHLLRREHFFDEQ